MSITIERLMSVLRYDAVTGVFTWLVGGRTRVGGSAAGTVDKKGYVVIQIDRRLYKAHRLAWFYMRGVWPPDQIDHRDGNKKHNALTNLRVASNSINQQNVRQPYKNNKCGVLGVHICGNGRYRAQVKLAGKTLHLGRFSTAEDAHEAYVLAKRRLHQGSTI
jgi:hypothetical protein